MRRRMSRAEAARIVARLESQGATFSPVAEFPGWYRAHVPGPEIWPGSSRWTCSTDEMDTEAALARAFAIRVTNVQGAAA